MAKRKRKMTLFDVINSGQPIGIQVRQRVPTYQPTPELPFQKKLAKLFGRSPKTRDPNHPLSAAEELELLRRELGAKPASVPVESTADVSAKSHETTVAEYDPTARFSEPSEPRSSSRRVAEIAQDLSDEPPAAVKASRKRIGTFLVEKWSTVSPRVQSAKVRMLQWASAAWQHAQAHVDSLRNLNTRHAATAATVLGGIIVLGGSFYVGKLLLQRPATDPALVDADGINTNPRPDVLDVNAHANQAIANVSNRAPDVALERGATPTPTAPAGRGVFGGRNTDLNYVIIQSYYTQAEADAAVDVLSKYNIRAGVEKNLPGWSNGDRDFFSVVSFDGYAKMKDNAVYQAFLTTLGKISDRETGSMLPKRLDPRPYKYRAAQ